MSDMNILKFKEEDTFKAVIRVFGIGGGGCNAVEHMAQKGIEGVEFFVVNTDLQHLNMLTCGKKIQIGKKTTKGLGAGSDPDVGKKAAEEDADMLADAISGADIVFLIAGFGGGTGTGATPVVARIARELGCLSIAMVTKPFSFEGKKRDRKAMSGLRRLKDYADTIVCVSNDKIFDFISQDTTMIDAFKVADDLLHNGVRAISDLITRTGIINLDFADVKNVMSERGRAVLAFGEGKGKGRVVGAVEAALASPFFEKRHISGAKGILVNITGGKEITLHELNLAISGIQKKCDPDANIIFGTVYDETFQDSASVTIIATGLDLELGADAAIAAVQEQAQQAASESPEQGTLEFQTASKGRFEKMDPTVYADEDLDVPTFMRKGAAPETSEEEEVFGSEKMRISF